MLFFVLVMGVGLTLHAQNGGLKEYAGKYIFEPGSIFTPLLAQSVMAFISL